MGLLWKLAANSIGGLFVLWLANTVFDVGIGYLWWPLALSAIGGVPGALVAILLHYVMLS
ncbi:MAG: pro-sigmaK processing inhibitor BofA family protein [Methanobacteriota archaeon]